MGSSSRTCASGPSAHRFSERSDTQNDDEREERSVSVPTSAARGRPTVWKTDEIPGRIADPPEPGVVSEVGALCSTR